MTNSTSDTTKPANDEPQAGGFQPISVRVREACRLTGIGRSKFYELVASGEIEVIKVGAMTLVSYDGLRRFVNRAQKSTTTSLQRAED